MSAFVRRCIWPVSSRVSLPIRIPSIDEVIDLSIALPHWKRATYLHEKNAPSALRPVIIEDDIEEHVVDDEQDDSLIRDDQRQLDAETRLREEPDVDEVDIVMGWKPSLGTGRYA